MSEQKFDKVKYDHAYVKGHYDIISTNVPKEKNLKERIKAVADREGISVTQWVIKALERELEWYE